jgi:hypothetical protein
MIGGRTDKFVIEVTTCDCGREADEVRVAMIDRRGEARQIMTGMRTLCPGRKAI